MSLKLTIGYIINKNPSAYLTVLSLGRENNRAYVICCCVCGKYKKVLVDNLLHGKHHSCGCMKGELISKKKTKYEGNIKEVYSAYKAMNRRCYTKEDKYYPNYGGRGVVVCDEWVNDYIAFLNWSKQNGWKKGLEIDKDGLGDGLLYSPTTCQWVTKRQNNLRRADTRMVYYNGEHISVSELSRRVGVHKSTLTYRLNKNWPNDILFTNPCKIIANAK